MARESFQNFATSAITGSITNVSTSFSVTGGSGSSFPAANFVVCIDTELIYIASRSTDTFTVASGGRGWDGTTAASHSAAATVQISATAFDFNHLWANTADTFNPLVPPTQQPLSATGVPTGTASAYDNEFEAIGSWVTSPAAGSVPGDAIYNAGVTVPSHLLVSRGATDSNLYTTYVSFGQSSGTTFTVTCKMTSCLNFVQQGTQLSDFHLFVSDQTNPTSAVSSGNMMKFIIEDSAASTSNTMNTNARTARAVSVASGSGTQQGASVLLPYGLPIFIRINNNGAGKWRTFIGDGVSYSLVSDFTQSFTPNTIGFHCSVGNTTSSQIVLVDFVRVIIGTRLQFYL